MKWKTLQRLLAALILLAGAAILSACQAVEAAANGAGTEQAGGAPFLLPTMESMPGNTSTAAAVLPTRAPTLARTLTPARTPTPAPSPTATLPAGYAQVEAGSVSVPILMYHGISSQGNTRYIVTVDDFRRQMQVLREAGYQTVTISALANVIRSGGALPKKPVAITFDDGYLNVHENAFPILEAYGFTATVYVISNTLEEGQGYGYMQASELKELARAGWEIGSHSVSHSSLKTTKLGLRREVEGSKADLEQALGVPVRSFSYPYAVSNDWISQQVQEFGYESAVGVDIWMTHKPERLFFLSRREVRRSTTLQEFQELLEPGPYEATPEWQE